MPIAARIVLGAAGAAVVFATILSAVKAMILPRRASNRLARVAIAAVQVGFRLRAGRSASYERRDRLMAMLGPTALLAMLVVWLVSLLAGFTLLHMGVGGRSFGRAVELAGSSTLTGSSVTGHMGDSLLNYIEGGMGLLLLTLLITYLPSIYGAFSRRENGVSFLRVRAGNPPRAASMLIRYQRIEGGDHQLTALWQQWESWFVDVEESHSTFPILAFFRSPEPDESWVTAAGTLLDAASFWVAAVDHPRDPDAQLCIRAGYLALRRIADTFRVPYDPDPRPDAPISVSRAEWDAAMAEMAEAGVPVLADRETAWRAWRGWRVNYDTVLLDLARLVEAPPVPWLSDRSPAVGRGPRWPPSLNGRRLPRLARRPAR